MTDKPIRLGVECWNCEHFWWPVIHRPGDQTVKCPRCGEVNPT